MLFSFPYTDVVDRPVCCNKQRKIKEGLHDLGVFATCITLPKVRWLPQLTHSSGTCLDYFTGKRCGHFIYGLSAFSIEISAI